MREILKQCFAMLAGAITALVIAAMALVLCAILVGCSARKPQMHSTDPALMFPKPSPDANCYGDSGANFQTCNPKPNTQDAFDFGSQNWTIEGNDSIVICGLNGCPPHPDPTPKIKWRPI